MNNLDDWLNSLGINDTQEQPHPADNLPIVPESQQPQETEHSNTPLSEEDINDILAENGFEEPTYDEAEEIDDEREFYDENGDEGRDLDAEEEEVLEERVQSGDITVVEQAIREIDEDIALEAVQSVNEGDYPEHNPDEELTNLNQAADEAYQMVVEAVTDTDTVSTTDAEQPLLPPNSPTLLIDDSTSRFSGTEWYNEIQNQRIILAGCGGIGSNLAFQLARMHPDALFLYDDDMVERANMSGQLFCQDDVGKFKVNAVSDMVHKYTTIDHLYANAIRFGDNSEAADIMICGFDNMAARKTFFTIWHEHVRVKTVEDRKKCLYLDGRLSIDTLQILCIRGDDTYNIKRYEDNFLFKDSEADQTVCSMKQTTYLACMIGSLMTNLFTNFVANTLDPVIPYDLPFFIEYDAQNMIFKTEN